MNFFIVDIKSKAINAVVIDSNASVEVAFLTFLHIVPRQLHLVVLDSCC